MENMNHTTKPIIAVTPLQLSVLAEARKVCAEIEGMAAATYVNHPDYARANLFNLGRVAEAASRGSDSVLNVLITVKYFGDVDVPDAIIHGERGDNE